MKKLAVLLPLLALIVPLASVSAAGHTKGQDVYRNACSSCHDSGIAGAPVTGDKDAWKGRIQQGLPTLSEHAIKGYHGAMGYMPPKGGNSALTDEEVSAAVEYMVQQSQ